MTAPEMPAGFIRGLVILTPVTGTCCCCEGFFEFLDSFGKSPWGDKMGGPGEPICDAAVVVTLVANWGLGTVAAAVEAGTAVTVNKFWLTL